MKTNFLLSFFSALFIGLSANAAIVDPDNNTNNHETIVKTETFTASYKNESYSGTFEHLECTAYIFNNNKIEIKVLHSPKRKFGGFNTYKFDKISYPLDTFYSKVDLSNSIFKNPNDFSKKEIFENDTTGFEYTYYATGGLDGEGELFTVTLIPTIYLNSSVTVNVFGHELSVPAEYDPHNDYIDRLDVDRNGFIDAVDASWILKIYSENSTGNNIKTIGDIYDISNNS